MTISSNEETVIKKRHYDKFDFDEIDTRTEQAKIISDYLENMYKALRLMYEFFIFILPMFFFVVIIYHISPAQRVKLFIRDIPELVLMIVKALILTVHEITTAAIGLLFV